MSPASSQQSDTAHQTDQDNPTATRPLRADAARNQQRVLDAARELFARRGMDITLDQVAEQAGVGVGTVYRRFGDKLTLLQGVLYQNLDLLSEQAEAAAEHPDPWQGLVEFCEYACANLAENRALGHVLLSLDADSGDRFGAVRERVQPAVNRAVERAKAAGELRPDAEVGDFFALLHMISGLAEFARPVNPEVWRRYLTLVLDGLRADGAPRDPLPIRGLTDGEIEHAKSHYHKRRR
ncbi:TetR/AcrR family transcriptional regulator [Skermania piniformis]|uniref:TetR/AcrR family transcriptional regulator n=1 Tax=Skermania pinensis TaxID=39122 RepID=A0ABX8S726_9ACTN|nr:TetR/AcrR family transcriptional regulator [Skermania piniformis]QXQ12827.1 TetR/AcrR family transcriptional regulator [Skermania piniformis]